MSKHPLFRFAYFPSPAGDGRSLWLGGAGSTAALNEALSPDTLGRSAVPLRCFS